MPEEHIKQSFVSMYELLMDLREAAMERDDDEEKALIQNFLMGYDSIYQQCKELAPPQEES